LVGHRYLYGVCAPGGVSVDLAPPAVALLADRLAVVRVQLDSLERGLRSTSSFLDRLEEIGVLDAQTARDYGVVGPVARASGGDADLRRLLPYAAYSELEVPAVVEAEGDGAARLRVLFAEARAATHLCESAARRMPAGPITTPVTIARGRAIGAVEAPAGATYHWVDLSDEGTIVRYHIAPPSFANLHAFAAAVEGAAFQDFPIILSTFNLSLAESDR
jgi:Ni,Fe-hydrogenase III large subunit